MLLATNRLVSPEEVQVADERGGTAERAIILDNATSTQKKKESLWVGFIEDSSGKMHNIMKFPQKTQKRTGKKYSNLHSCEYCKTGQSMVYCQECDLCFCYPLRLSKVMKEAGLTLGEPRKQSCFEEHVNMMGRRSSGRSSGRVVQLDHHFQCEEV